MKNCEKFEDIETREQIPVKTGVYIVKRKENIIYIGESKNLYKRYTLLTFLNGKKVTADIEHLRGKNQRTNREQELVRKHEPEYNKHQNKIYGKTK